MKSRILETLQKLSIGNHPLKHDLSTALGFTPEQIASQAEKVLSNILHNYSAFAVSTIDSFFQKVVRTFAREIGVQGGFQVELDQKKVISEVVDRLLQEVGQHLELTDWLTQFAIYNITEGRRWDSKKDIKSLSDELFKELFIQHKNVIFDKVEDNQFMLSYLKRLNTIKKGFEVEMNDFGLKALSILQQHDLLTEDFTQGQRGVAGYFLKLSKGLIVAPNSYVYGALNDQKWYSKKSDRKDKIEQAISNGLYENLKKCISFYEVNFKNYFTTSSVISNIYTLGILSKVNQYLHQYREENDTLLISDFPVFLNQIINDSDTPYIYEKIGSRYKHYLIDEFQDTSALQWNNFKPLLKDSVAANQFNMIVGDIKQSIYRWRGGNWKLLLDQVQTDIGSGEVELKELNTNWRSRKNIIDFNNAFFEVAPNVLYDKLRNSASLETPAMNSIKSAYQDSYQQIAEKDNVDGGLVKVNFFESANKQEFGEQSLNLIISRIEELQEANYKLRDIAILVRTSREGKKVTDALMEYEKGNPNSKYQYDIISNESLYLKNSPLIHLIIQAFYFIMDENESLHRTQLKYAAEYHLEDACDNTETILKSNLNTLKSLALVDLVEELIRLFDLKKDKNQLVYLMAFQDAVLDYSKNKHNSIEGFMQWWQENDQRAIQVSENQEAIRLMTVHKSKGLQFKAVILPFCNWGLDHSTGGDKQNIVWCQTRDKEAFSSLPFLPLKYKADMSQTLFSIDYWEERAKAYMDNLNLLYVACTRAEEVLYINAEYPKNRGALSGVSDVLYQFLSNGGFEGSSWNEENMIFESGDMVAFSIYEDEKKHKELYLNQFVSQPWNERKELQANHNTFWYDENVKAKMTEGEMMHWILSKITYHNDLDLAVSRACATFNLDKKASQNLGVKLFNLINNDNIKRWFSEDWYVKNEVNILTSTGDIQRPDRVIIKDNHAIVIDYKTGAYSNKHHRQVKSYQLLLQDMGYENVLGYLLYVNEAKVEEVI